MAKVTLKLDTRKNSLKKDGTYPAILEVSHQKKSGRISLRYSFKIKDWDAETSTVKNINNHKLISAKLQSQYSKAESYLRNHKVEIDIMSINELTNRIKAEVFANDKTTERSKEIYVAKKTNGASITDFARQKLTRLRQSGKNGYVSAIETAIASLRRYTNRPEGDILFSEIDLIFLKNFTALCESRGNKPNTISAYLRPIKTLFHEAVVEEIISTELNPFPKFKMPKATQTKKRSLRIDTIQAIRKLELKEKSAIWDARNYFLFMFNNMGINLIDIAQLKKNQIKDAVYESNKLVSGRLDYTRSKNGRQYSIKLTTESIAILNEYQIEEKKSNDLIFPIGYAKTEAGFNTYKKKRQRINGRIKELGVMVGLEENITSYYARHSWATIAKRKMIPISVIAEGLGHSDLKTTQIYLDTFDDDVMDDANDEIVK